MAVAAADAGVRVRGRSVPVAAKLVRLRRFNLALSAAHTAQAALILALSSGFSLPVTASFLEFDAVRETLVARPRELFTLEIGPLVALFSLLSAAAHFAVALPRGHAWYSRNLMRGINPARWIEYALSSSVMIVVIAMLAGIYDVVSLLALFGVNAAMILFGWTMELANQGRARVRWAPFWFGSIAGAVPWAAIAIYLAGAADPPGFVYAIFVSLFLFFNVFALNMALQYAKAGRWRDYLFGERAYMVLSLAAKSLLAWQVFAGTLQP